MAISYQFIIARSQIQCLNPLADAGKRLLVIEQLALDNLRIIRDALHNPTPYNSLSCVLYHYIMKKLKSKPPSFCLN